MFYLFNTSLLNITVSLSLSLFLSLFFLSLCISIQIKCRLDEHKTFISKTLEIVMSPNLLLVLYVHQSLSLFDDDVIVVVILLFNLI